MHSATVNRMKMGGYLSVRFPVRKEPIVKVGGGRGNFKLHSTNESRWEYEDIKTISSKTEGKGLMKAVFTDEIASLDGNNIPEKLMTEFQKKQKRDPNLKILILLSGSMASRARKRAWDIGQVNT